MAPMKTEITTLITPAELIQGLPCKEQTHKTIQRARQEAIDIIQGIDDRLLVIVGPCSIHNYKAAIQFGEKLKSIADQIAKELCIMMRVYFEKPRTSLGWKGLINDPDLDGSFKVNKGLKLARQVLLDLNSIGIPTATEFLDPITPAYINDLISWGAIGARTTESQMHRDLASSLSMPIGFKNGTDGNTKIAVAAILAANSPQHMLGINQAGEAAVISSTGNKNCHIILRGGKDNTNFDAHSIDDVTRSLNKHHLPPRVMVDCSHGNSQHIETNQIHVANNLCEQISAGSAAIMGVMLESHITSGKQLFQLGDTPKWDQSITDACLDWNTTENILRKLAAAVTARRQHANTE